MKSLCELSCTLLILCMCLSSSVDGQKKNKPPRWKPKSRPYNGDTIIAKSSGSDIKLACPAYGYPKPSTTWYKDEVLFDPTQRPKTKARYSSLLLNDVQEGDKGRYKCVVENSEGSIEFTFIVDVIRTSWPLVIEEPQNVTVTEGERVELRCRALNDPDATTQWIKRNSDMDSSNADKNFLDQQNGPELVIESASLSDAGKYTCMVGNYIGIKSVDAWVNVRPKTTTTTTTTTTTRPPTTTTESTTTTTTTQSTTTTTTMETTTTATAMDFFDGGHLRPDITDDEDVYEGSGNEETEKQKKKNKKKKKKNRKKKKKDRKKKKKERQRERERKQQQREKKRQEELDRMNKETVHSDKDLPDQTYPHIFDPSMNNQDHFYPVFHTTPPTEDDNEFFANGNFNGDRTQDISNSGNSFINDNDRLPTNNDPFNDFPEGQQQEEEGMSAWTIYIIVGLVAGGVLLVGLVAIVVALCCNRIEDRNGYKHTSV